MGRGPLGEIRYISDDVPHKPQATSSIHVREDGSAFSLQRQEVLLRAAQIASMLQKDCGLTKGDALYIADAQLAKRTEWMIACYKLGVVPLMIGPQVPLNFLHNAERMHI